MLKQSYLCVLISICLAVSLGGLSALPVQAATITVTTTSDGVTPGGCTTATCTLRDAVILANATPEADVINLPAGMFTVLSGGSSGGNEDAALTGDIDITAPVTIVGLGATTSKLYAPYDRVLDIHPSAGMVILESVGFEMSQGVFAVINGGALRCSGPGPQVTIYNSRFFLNSAGAAGGHGGALYLDNCATIIENTTLERNYTIGDGSLGGGIYARQGSLTMRGVNIKGNSSKSHGGGIYLDGTTTVITNSMITGNNASQAGGSGGGLYGSSAPSNVLIDSSQISGNTAVADGGGLATAGTVIIRNSTLGANTALGSGGGVANAGSLQVLNSTIAYNMANQNGGSGIGGGLASLATGATAEIKNTILANNSRNPTGWNDCAVAAGTVVSMGYNLVRTAGTCESFSLDEYDILGQDPLLGALANNGGFTQTYALALGSPAVNHGSPVDGLIPSYDQRGEGFPRILIGRLDIGAYELRGLDTYLPLLLRLP